MCSRKRPCLPQRLPKGKAKFKGSGDDATHTLDTTLDLIFFLQPWTDF